MECSIVFALFVLIGAGRDRVSGLGARPIRVANVSLRLTGLRARFSGLVSGFKFLGVGPKFIGVGSKV